MTTVQPYDVVIFKNNNQGLWKEVKFEEKPYRLAFAVKEAVRACAKRGSAHCMWPAPCDVAAVIQKNFKTPRILCLTLSKGDLKQELEATLPGLRRFQRDWPIQGISQEWWTPGMDVFPPDAAEPPAAPMASVVVLPSIPATPADPPAKRQRVEEPPQNKPPRGRGPITYQR